MFDDDLAGPPQTTEPREPDQTKPAARGRGARRASLRAVAWLIAVAAALYYPVGMALVHQINDDVDFAPSAAHAVPGGSAAVAMTAALIDREVNDTDWIANNPFIFPSAALDNMPNFQLGMKAALFRFAIEMTDQMGRTRGSSQADKDLDSAAGELKFPGDVWVWSPSISIFPTAASENHYRKAMTLLDSYNQRLAAGDAVFDRRADNLLATMDRFAADLGSASAELDHHIRDHAGGFDGGFLDFAADDLFFNVKGRLYGYTMILGALREDFSKVITERQIDAAWAQMHDSLRIAAALDPVLIVNGTPDGMAPSHLVAQGFYLLRARTQLREITNILLK